MKGMELARAYYEDYGRALIDGPLAAYKSAIAVGLVGEGSECFGYDDAFSTDHDFGPGFCIWVPQALYDQAGAALEAAYASLPEEYLGYRRVATPQAGKRVGVWGIEAFYARYTGLARPPRDNLEWLRIPEDFLAVATNGEVFFDAPGLFSQWRAQLLDFYPEDVLRKKLACRCAIMAQSGQYNYGRSMARGDGHAAYLACATFIQSALSAIHLLNGRYAPFYKWLFRSAEDLPLFRASVLRLKALAETPDSADHGPEKCALIEAVCTDIADHLAARGYTQTREPFLQVQGEALIRGIADSRLRAMHIMVDK
ncbi:MAG: DUF4037 domain-containing protein [Peptococcaceae bacterium]|nr:DUF4037 domain-containing protein [Peptococcaceae bacterium]